MKYDRFNLEEEIQNVWHTKDDLDAIAERVYDDPDGPMTEDEIGNVLIGLSVLHETRCKKLWKVFETMVHEECFKTTVEINNEETIKALKKQGSIFASRIEPHDTGHLHTTISTLEHRIKELENE